MLSPSEDVSPLFEEEADNGTRGGDLVPDACIVRCSHCECDELLVFHEEDEDTKDVRIGYVMTKASVDAAFIAANRTIEVACLMMVFVGRRGWFERLLVLATSSGRIDKFGKKRSRVLYGLFCLRFVVGINLWQEAMTFEIW